MNSVQRSFCSLCHFFLFNSRVISLIIILESKLREKNISVLRHILCSEKSSLSAKWIIYYIYIYYTFTGTLKAKEMLPVSTENALFDALWMKGKLSGSGFLLHQHSQISLRAKLPVLLLLVWGRAQRIWGLGWIHTGYSSFPWTSKWFDSEVSSEQFHP